VLAVPARLAPRLVGLGEEAVARELRAALIDLLAGLSVNPLAVDGPATGAP
jgi:hypothetical protein